MSDRATRPRTSRRTSVCARALAAACLLAIALPVTGCGEASHPARVASLPTLGTTIAHASPAAGPGVPDPDGRPRAPLDDTNAQFAALYGPWTACLRAHRYVDALTSRAKLTVAAKCEHLDPLPAWQVDPADPQARAFIGRVVTCLQARGYHARAVLLANAILQPSFWNIEYSPRNLNYTPRRPVAAQDACQQKALR